MKKNEVYLTFVLTALTLIVMIFLGTSLFSSFGKITGYATTSPVNINISVAGSNAPVVLVDNVTMTSVASGPNEGPTTTPVKINFTVYDGDGNGNINDSEAQIKFTLSGEETRSNTSCYNSADYSIYYSNYTCTVVMYWYDGSGTWTINATIKDNDGNKVDNTTTRFYVGPTDGLTAAPTSLTWGTVTAGTPDQESNNDPILLNNTGNVHKHVRVNSTNLRGETTPTQAIWAGNISIKDAAGCGGTNMTDHSYTNITSAVLFKGNFTVNNGTAGQEQLYFCFETVGSELTAQAYSTGNESAWTLQIVTQS
jgi:hypothetical protein